VRRGLITALALALLAGCGGGETRLSAKDYRAKATAICAATKRQTDALGRPKGTSQFKVFLSRGLKVTERNLRRFQALRPPKDLQAAHDAIVAAERSGQRQLQAVATRLHGDSRDLAVLRQVQPELAKISSSTQTRYRAAGLAGCANA
jgi:uncharacterized lipoprotein